MLTLGWDMPVAQTPHPCNRYGLMKADEEACSELDRILGAQNIKAVFQPIVSLVDASIVGYEALSRGPRGSLLERPDKLFAAAEKVNKLWDLELLCRSKALERAREMDSDKMMFINVAPHIIHDPRFQKGLTREIMAKYKIDAANIIFEITEKTSIDDYRSFRRVLDNYTSQGYKIALDDTGSGYSGLKLLAETRPQFVKIDMDLVRDIDKDSLKHALMKAFYEFSLATNIKIIAEGIETLDELNALIDIGISYGQGYLMQKPAPEFLELPPTIKEHIVARNRMKRKETVHTALTIPIGELARRDVPFTPEKLGCHAIDHFNANRNLMGIPVVEGGRPVGLLMKEKFFANLATQYGVAVYMNRPIRLLMDVNPLIVDYNTPLEQVSKAAISRPEVSLYDYIIVIKEGQYYGITTVRNLLDKTTQLEINRAKYSNPLSGLPGNVIIENKLSELIESAQPFAVLYFDLDNFKAYNDVYGFDNGDKVLRMTAQVIENQICHMGFNDAFVGHIGGDDFIAVFTDLAVEPLCQKIIEAFDKRVRDFYTEEDQKNGYLITKNRHGVQEKFPITTMSIAVVKNSGALFRNVAELAEAAGVVKKKCKLVWHSCYCVDGTLDDVNTKLTRS